MNYTLTLVFSLSILFAAVIGRIRFKQIDPAYRPFLYWIWLSLANELVSIVLAYTIRNNVVSNNIYLLLQALLLTWQFKNWKLFRYQRPLYPMLLGLFFTAWAVEMIIKGMSSFCSFFIILHSFIIVLLSISLVNQLIVSEHRSLLKQARFLICIIFIIYFTFSTLTETFWWYGLSENKEFRVSIYNIFQYVNLFSNLIYALAVLWMPAKPKFILPYSSQA